jgi:hypothetical protein
MVAHQDVSVDVNTVLPRDLHEAAVEENTVAIRSEYRLPVVASDDEVLRQVGEPEAGKAGHGVSTPPDEIRLQANDRRISFNGV